MSTCKSFAPIVDEHSRILILGSMPGIKSLEQQEYYAHPQNRFWRLLALLLNEDVPQDYAAKQALLHKHHLALWDTLGYCERDGSLDSNIKNEAPNAVVELAGELPHLQPLKNILPKNCRSRCRSFICRLQVLPTRACVWRIWQSIGRLFCNF